MTRGLALHQFEDAMNRRLLEVRQIHGNLCQPTNQKSRPFTKRNPPLENRTALATFFAISTSGVLRKTL